MNSLELQLTEQVLNNPDFQGPVLVLVDASLEAWSIRLGKQLGEFFKRTFVEKSNDKKLIFISKNPESTSQFNGSAADVFYFNNIPSPNRAAGFSLPIEDRNYYNRFGAGIVEFYARLSNDTPIIKIEFANLADSALSPEQLDNLRQHEIPKLLDMLAYDSRSGYPHSLRLAHDNVAITPEDMDAIARYYDGLRGQVGARDALHQQHHGTIRKNTGGDF
jgi:hypothetical protein